MLQKKVVLRWETGKVTPDISLLIPMTKELGVNISEILSGKLEKKTNEDLEEIIQYVDINKKLEVTSSYYICFYPSTMFNN